MIAFNEQIVSNLGCTLSKVLPINFYRLVNSLGISITAIFPKVSKALGANSFSLLESKGISASFKDNECFFLEINSVAIVSINKVLNLNLPMSVDFVTEYFIKPIMSPELSGYNMINTITYIVILIIACSIIYFFLRKKVKFDEKFFLAISPYILIGVSLRVLMHQIEAGNLIIEGITKTANPLQIGFWFFTPGVWILTFAIVLAGLLIAQVWKELNHNRLFAFGLIIALPLVLFNFINFNNWIWFIGTLILIIITTYTIIQLIDKLTPYKILEDSLNIFIIMGQAIDGIASVVAITFFNFTEQHVVSNIVINIHPILFVIIKLVLAILICYSLDDYLKDSIKKYQNKPGKNLDIKNKIGFTKVVIAILGFATGLTSLFKMGLI